MYWFHVVSVKRCRKATSNPGCSVEVHYKDDHAMPMERYDKKNSSRGTNSSGSHACCYYCNMASSKPDNPIKKKMSDFRRYELLVELIPGMESEEIKCTLFVE